MKVLITIFTLCILLSCDKNDKASNTNFIDNDQFSFVNYEPDSILNNEDVFLIDLDNDEIMDIRIVSFEGNNKPIGAINEAFTLSIGNFIGSGSTNVDTIAFDETVDMKLSWYESISLFTDKINYVGIRKTSNQDTSYGWIKLEIFPNSISIDSHYLRKDSNVDVKAGISEY